MTNQLETAREWIADLNKIIDKTDNECTKEKRDVLEWLVEVVELYELTSAPISHKLAILNKFLQERNIGLWGESVISDAMKYVEELESEIDGILQTLEDKEPYYSNLCLMLEKQNKRYKQALEEIKNNSKYDWDIYDAVAIAIRALEGEG